MQLGAGDVLVINNSATVAGEIDGLIGDERVVLHLGARLDGDDRVVELRTTPDAARALLDASPGDVVEIGRGEARFTLGEPWPTGRPSSPTGVGNRLWRAHVDGDLHKVVAREGRPIAYGYLDQRYPLAAYQLAAYQTVFGLRPGSVEMASAGRPFTAELVAALVSRGVAFAPVTLQAGLSSQEEGEAPGPEWFEVSEASARQINSARDGGGRIIAVGTTATRAIESSVSAGDVLARPTCLAPALGRSGRRSRPRSIGVRRCGGRGLPVARVWRLGAAARWSLAPTRRVTSADWACHKRRLGVSQAPTGRVTSADWAVH